jgi:predicted AlkP superfamily pyrophosphatase or phosphodiesterase
MSGLALAAAAQTAKSEPATARPTRPIPAIERVLIISIDGLRPDRLLLADTPVLHGLIKHGAYTFWAQTTAVSTTLPSHTSMLTGVVPRKHKIEWNFDIPMREPVYSASPTVFELAKKWGYTTAFVIGKSKFEPLTKPGTLDYEFMPKEDYENDEPVVVEALKVLHEHKPDLMFVHFPGDDKAGHKYGWGSPEQLVAIAKADACIGRLLAQLDADGLRSSTLVIVTSDHGGAGLTHGADDFRSRYIPWIASGPGVKSAYDLTQSWDLLVRTEDTTATACYVLGLGQMPYFDGHPVYDAFVNPPRN